MKIKDELVLHGMIWAEADNTEYNNIGAFQISNSNTPGYYIVQWTGNAYTLQGKCTCRAFDHPVIIPEGELVCLAKFMTPMRETSYWYHDLDEEIPIRVKLEQVLMPFIELIQYINTTNRLTSRFKGYACMNPCLLYEHNHQIILDKIESRKIFTMTNMCGIKITTMQIVMILMMMIINNSYCIFNIH